MKKFLKWIFRIFILLLLIFIAIWAYFYFYPVYSNSHIPVWYFSENIDDSDNNGYTELQQGFSSFSDAQRERIQATELLYSCVIKNENCDLYIDETTTIEDVKRTQEQFKNQQFTEIKEGFQKLWVTDAIRSILDEYLEFLSNASEKEEFKSIWFDEKNILWQIQKIQRVKDMYYILENDKKGFEFAKKHFEITDSIVRNQDIDYFVYSRIMNTMISDLEYFQNLLENTNLPYKVFIKNIIEKNSYIEIPMKNVLISQYEQDFLNMQKIYEETPNTWKKKFFYDFEDTKNLLQTMYYHLIEWSKTNESFEIKKNWKNFIWRTLLETLSPQGFKYKVEEIYKEYRDKYKILSDML